MKMKKINSININSGKYKGKKVLLPDVTTTRPTKSIVRNSIFNTLQNEIFDKNFIEMFAGSGSVGFEAISRGAKKLFLFEQGKEAIKNLKLNSQNFLDSEITIIQGDSFQNINQILKSVDKIILYIDPPFNIRQGVENIYLQITKFIENLDKSKINLIIIEHISKEKFPKNIGDFSLYKSKKFGKTTISYFY
jgi:16S rRNA (guanine(966)-N(2))-methyltransferase RsmD